MGKDAGKYSAKATNKCGKAETATTLSIGIPPKIKKSYKDAVSKEGEDVSLDLEVSGVPTPQVQWYHHDKLIDSDDKYKVSRHQGVMLYSLINNIHIIIEYIYIYIKLPLFIFI